MWQLCADKNIPENETKQQSMHCKKRKKKYQKNVRYTTISA